MMQSCIAEDLTQLSKRCYDSIIQPKWMQTMATITLKNVPDELYKALKHKAAIHRRSINNEAIVNLERALRARKIESATMLIEALQLRERAQNIYLTDKMLAADKDKGRK